MDVLVSDEQRVRHVVLNRPAKRNALTLAMCHQIVEAVRSAEALQQIGCILISGQGSVFCAGMDLLEAAPVADLAQAHEKLFTLGAQASKPIVVAVNGSALAGGLGLVAQGHIVLASADAQFGLPEVRVGLWPFVVGRCLERALGKRKALELSLTGDSFDAQQAQAWGLVQRIYSVAELAEAAKTLARDLAMRSPTAIQLGLQYVREAEGKSSEDAGKLAVALRGQLMAGADYREGTAAFKEKREARWPSLTHRH